MFGNGQVVDFETAAGDIEGTGKETGKYVMRTMQFVYDADKGLAKTWTDPKGKVVNMINPKYYTAEGEYFTVAPVGLTRYFVSFDVAVKGAVIVVSADSFPGTYYVTGDTYARSEASGNDEFFQFIIPKAKVQSENTITLEAEGDPSVFNMSLKVLRPADGQMMKLVKYELLEGTVAVAEDTNINMYHNHVLVASEG